MLIILKYRYRDIFKILYQYHILDRLPTGHVTQSMCSKLLAFNMGKWNWSFISA